MRIMIALATVVAMQASGQDSPETLVRLALEKVSRDKAILQTLECNKDEKTYELDGKGNPKGEAALENEKSYITMSLPKLLKEGRYQYKHEGVEIIGDRPAIKLALSPGPHEKQPKPETIPGKGIEGMIAQGVEDGMNKVLNSLEGHLYLDQETLGIVRFEGSLPKGVEIHHLIAWVSITDIKYDQMYAFGIWVPKKTVADTRIAKFLPRPRKYRRTIKTFENYRPKAPQ